MAGKNVLSEQVEPGEAGGGTSSQNASTVAPFITSLAMRVGLGMVFVLFGAGKLISPQEWVVYVPQWLGQSMARWNGGSPFSIFSLLGIFELMLGLQIVAGFCLRASVVVAIVELALIVGCVGLDHTGVRDLGLLLGIAVPLLLKDPMREPWSLDEWIGRVLGRRPKLVRTLVVGWGAVLFAGGWMAMRTRELPASARQDAVHPGFELSDSASRVTEIDAASADATGEPVLPVPLEVKVDPRKVALGQELFYERKLSGDQSLSCSSCHDLKNWGMDQVRFPNGIRGQRGEINTPTVFNAALNLHQFWDGRASTLSAQALGPVQNPREMGANWSTVEARIASDPHYQRQFSEVMPSRRINRETITEVIAEFEATLLTPDARFDQWLRGNRTILSVEEQQGYQLFKDIGCISCHQGVNLGGNMYQTLGKFGDYFKDRGGPLMHADMGRYNVTGLESDRHKFKVPGLRNVARTAPYFHDGNIVTLEEAVNTMAHYQLGRRLASEQVKQIVAFLRSLNGELPKHVAH